MSLSDDERNALVAYRLEKANRTYKQAVDSVPLGYWEMTANRLYYSAYYAVSALLLNKGFTVQTHNGIIQMLGLHLIKPGLLDKSYGTLYGKLFSMRQTGDYGDTFELEEDDVLPLVEPTKNLINTISKLLKNNK
ncbi:MAG: HEPN domain-containing protein [Bacteroidales bacterium]|nr:HEPN domain-containing protein [Bacteroidales bacterium]